MKHTIQQISPALQTAAAPGLQRRQLGRIAFGAVAALGLAACGGGGGDPAPALNLRAAYDRVDGGMDHDDVKKAVGSAPTSGTLITQYWETSSERLTCTYTILSNGSYYLVGALCDGPNGGFLSKEFQIKI